MVPNLLGLRHEQRISAQSAIRAIRHGLGQSEVFG